MPYPSLVILSKRSVRQIVSSAVNGYERPYKQERIGVLLGRILDDVVMVVQAVQYNQGVRKRTFAEIDVNKYFMRVHSLASQKRLMYLGGYHTHNEIAGRISSSMSAEDKEPLISIPIQIIELIATIWTSNQPLQSSKHYLQVRRGIYRIRIAARLFCHGYPTIPIFPG